jgi:hypothetical protein
MDDNISEQLCPETKEGKKRREGREEGRKMYEIHLCYCITHTSLGL